MAHRIALAFGEPDVLALMDRMSAAQFQHWCAYYALDPWGSERGDLSAAIIASTIANVNSRRRFRPRDFMPQFGRKGTSDPEKMKAILMMNPRLRKSQKMSQNPKLRKSMKRRLKIRLTIK